MALMATDKTTYPCPLGLERAKKVADELINAVHDALSWHGPRRG